MRETAFDASASHRLSDGELPTRTNGYGCGFSWRGAAVFGILGGVPVAPLVALYMVFSVQFPITVALGFLLTDEVVKVFLRCGRRQHHYKIERTWLTW